MRVTILEEQRAYFREHQFIEFEEIIENEQIPILKNILSNSSPGSCDVWRRNAELKEIIANRQFGEVVARLTDQRPLRLGLDLILSIDQWKPGATLQDYAPFQGIVGGMLIGFKGAWESEEVLPIPSQEGSAVILGPELIFPELDSHIPRENRWLLIIYADSKARFIPSKLGFEGGELKKIGYSFGDRLRDEEHPVVCS